MITGEPSELVVVWEKLKISPFLIVNMLEFSPTLAVKYPEVTDEALKMELPFFFK